MHCVDQSSETPQQRRERYLRCAAEAAAFAKRILDPSARNNHLYLGKCWREMAAEINEDEQADN